MISHHFSFVSGLLAFFLIFGISLSVTAGQVPFLKLKHMEGSLLINGNQINSIFYLKKDGPETALLKIAYEGNAQGKEIRGSEAAEVWQELQQNASFTALFLWVNHLGGRLGIPFHTIQSVYYTEPSQKTRAYLRIVHNADSKEVEGPEAEEIWQNLLK